MFQRIISTIALSFIFYIGISQTSFHRIYETSLMDPLTMTDSVFYHMASTTDNSGDVFAVGTLRVNDDQGDVEDFSIVFVKLSNKGDIDWQRELNLGKDSVEITSICDIAFNGAQDSILFVVDVEVNGAGKEIYGSMPKNGSEINLFTVGGFVSSPISSVPHVAPFVTGTDLLLTPTENNPIISRVLQDESLAWSRSYEFNNEDGASVLNFITDLKTSPLDSSIVIVGNSNPDLKQLVVAKLDSNGVQLWAESLTFSNVDVVNPTEVIPLENGNIAVVGTYIASLPTEISDGFVTILDTLGEVILSKTIQIDGARGGLLNVLEGSDGNLWMTGVHEINDTISYFLTNMTLEGTINYTTNYPGQRAGNNIFDSSLLPVPSTGGATFVGHGFKDEQPVMAVMKHDAQGMAFCSDTLPGITIDLPFSTDTLTTEVANGGIFFDTLVYEFGPFAGFTPPVLSVNTYPAFCPNEIIDTFLVASVSRVNPDSVTYLWSTGQTTDTIRVFSEGQYSVTVTIAEDVCFMMCDTVELTRLMLPQIEILQDNSQFCENDIVILNTDYTPGATIESYLWSTGEITESITVTQEGTYSVTVTDDCGEMAVSTISVTFPTFDPNVFFDANIDSLCIDGTAKLTAGYTGGGSNEVYTWSDGQVGNPVYVSTPGEYTVTATDECGLSDEFTLEVVFEVTATEAEIIVTPECNENNALQSRITIEAVSTSGEITIEIESFDSDGNSTNNEVITDNPARNLFVTTIANNSEFITFTVTVFNSCLETIARETIDPELLCGTILQYPIVFFPGGDDEASKKFGPIPSDTMDVDLITNVDFKVFNRWGETVHETTEILDAWDGRHKGEPAPSEVYIWYVTYMYEGRQVVDKGDVTLIR